MKARHIPSATRIAALAAFVVSLTGCSSTRVKTDFDPEARFGDFKTVAFHPRAGKTKAKEQGRDAPLLERRIERALQAELTKKGLSFVEAKDADVIVAFHAQIKTKRDVWVADYGWRRGWGRSVHVSEYPVGTLVVDLIDGRTRELVWRGTAKGAVDEEDTEESVRDAVRELLKEYPPRGR